MRADRPNHKRGSLSKLDVDDSLPVAMTVEQYRRANASGEGCTPEFVAWLSRGREGSAAGVAD